MNKINYVVREWEDRTERIRTVLREWSVRLLDDPAYQLAWADGLFDQAAELSLIELYLPWFKGDVNPDFEGNRLDQAILELERDLMSRARSRAASTSATANRMQDARRVALAEVVEWLRRVRDRV